MKKSIRIVAITAIAIVAITAAGISATLTAIEVGGNMQVATNPYGIPVELTTKTVPGPICSAIAGAVVRDHFGTSDAGVVGIARMYHDTRANSDFWDGRLMHHAAEATIDVADANLRRKPSRHRNVHDLVAYMRTNDYQAAIVSMDHPEWRHAVAVLVNEDGSWAVVDVAMALATLQGRMNTTPANSWDGSIRQPDNAVGAWIIYQAEKA